MHFEKVSKNKLIITFICPIRKSNPNAIGDKDLNYIDFVRTIKKKAYELNIIGFKLLNFSIRT